MIRKTLLFISFILAQVFFFPFQSLAQFTDIHDFDAVGNFPNGANPYGSLILSGNQLFGTASYGGEYGYGVVFSINTDGTGYTNLFDFNDTLGSTPLGNLLLLGNNLYGMASAGGQYSDGVIFRINTDGQGFTVLYNFMKEFGSYPKYGELIASGNKFFGVTDSGGIYNKGVLFSIDTNGSGFTVLKNFDSSAEYPCGELTLKGNWLYGMTHKGYLIQGCIFTIDTSGNNYNRIWDFNTSITNGEFPGEGDITFKGNRMYGMTTSGGQYRHGCIFSVDTDGSNFGLIHSFNDTLGASPEGGLIYGGNNLYGMAQYLSSGNYNGCIFSLNLNDSALSPLVEFTGDTGSCLGSNPYGDLILSGDALYGMCQSGGYANFGDIFTFRQNALSTGNVNSGYTGIRVYPNPSGGKFTGALNLAVTGITPITVKVYNSFGEKVYAQCNILDKMFNINLSFEPDGIYFYRVDDNAGNRVGEGKLIIEK